MAPHLIEAATTFQVGRVHRRIQESLSLPRSHVVGARSRARSAEGAAAALRGRNAALRAGCQKFTECVTHDCSREPHNLGPVVAGSDVVGLWSGRIKDFLDESLAFADGRSGRRLGRDTGLEPTQAKSVGRVEQQT